MGFLKNLLRNAVEDGISRGIRDAVSNSVEKAVAPKAEKFANDTAEQFSEASQTLEENKNQIDNSTNDELAESLAADVVFTSALQNFPKWTLSPIHDMNGSEEDDFVSVTINVDVQDNLVEKYQTELRFADFSGDFQLMKKTVNGKEHIVDFSFVPDSEIRYIIYK